MTTNCNRALHSEFNPFQLVSHWHLRILRKYRTRRSLRAVVCCQVHQHQCAASYKELSPRSLLCNRRFSKKFQNIRGFVSTCTRSSLVDFIKIPLYRWVDLFCWQKKPLQHYKNFREWVIDLESRRTAKQGQFWGLLHPPKTINLKVNGPYLCNAVISPGRVERHLIVCTEIFDLRSVAPCITHVGAFVCFMMNEGRASLWASTYPPRRISPKARSKHKSKRLAETFEQNEPHQRTQFTGTSPNTEVCPKSNRFHINNTNRNRMCHTFIRWRKLR